jgi:LysM repeat protein
MGGRGAVGWTVNRRQLAHVAAPAVFLLGVTVAVLLVRSGLEGHPAQTITTGPAAHSTGTTGTTGTTTGGQTTTSTAAARYYTVQKGDTYGSIAAKENTTVADLEALNPDVNPTTLQVGQRIRVG